MTPTQFCYWLRGYTEITNGKQLTSSSWGVIVEKLSDVNHNSISDDIVSNTMSANAFVFWLSGFVDINKENQPSEDEWKVILDHIDKVFIEVAPVCNEESIKEFLDAWRTGKEIPFPSPISNTKFCTDMKLCSADDNEEHS